MKKFLVILLTLLLMFVLVGCDQISIPGIGDIQIDLPSIGGGQSKAPGEGGLQEGTYHFAMDLMEMELTISADSATVIERNYWNQTSFVKCADVMIYTGNYELNNKGNVVITVSKVQKKGEYFGTEENIAEFLDSFSEPEIGLQIGEEKLALINGEIIAVDPQDISLTVRLDTSNHDFYLLEYDMGKDQEKLTIDYYPNGVRKSGTVKAGLMQEKVKFDEYGYELTRDVQREYHDNGIVKSEIYPYGFRSVPEGTKGDEERYKYDEQGRMIEELRGDSRIEYEYNSDGVLILEKRYSYENGELSGYSETKYVSYSKMYLIEYDLKDYTFEDKKIYRINEYWNRVRTQRIWPNYDEDTIYGYSVDVFDVDGNTRKEDRFYDADGRMESLVIYDKGKGKTRTDYAPNGEKYRIEESVLKFSESAGDSYVCTKWTLYDMKGIAIYEWNRFNDDSGNGECRDTDGNSFTCSYFSVVFSDSGEQMVVYFYDSDDAWAKTIAITENVETEYDENGEVISEKRRS